MAMFAENVACFSHKTLITVAFNTRGLDEALNHMLHPKGTKEGVLVLPQQYYSVATYYEPLVDVLPYASF